MPKPKQPTHRLTREEIAVCDEAWQAIERVIRIRKPAARLTLASRLFGLLTAEENRRAS
jgi:hypothetical protein